MEELTIKIIVDRDKLAEVLVEGYNVDNIEISTGKAFDPCIVDDEGFLNIKQADDGVLAEVRISVEELGNDTIYALVYEMMKELKERGKKIDMETFLFSVLDGFGDFSMEQANEFIIKILGKVEINVQD